MTLELRHAVGRGVLLAVFGALTLGTILLVSRAVAGADPGWGYAIVWCAWLAWSAYWFLLRVSFVVRLTPTVLEWETPLRRGSVPVSSLTGARPLKMGSSVEVFERAAGRPVLVQTSKGMAELLAALSEIRPDLPVRMGWWARFDERWGPSRLRRLDDPPPPAGPSGGGR